jgi:hypothetical protein
MRLSEAWRTAFSAFGFLVVFPLAVHAQGQAAEGVQVEMTRALGDGVYTVEQGVRGEREAVAHCRLCHSQDEWTSPIYFDAYLGLPISALFESISRTMPPPPSVQLTPQQYVDIIAYILRINGAPPGAGELPADVEGLATIRMSPSLTDG